MTDTTPPAALAVAAESIADRSLRRFASSDADLMKLNRDHAGDRDTLDRVTIGYASLTAVTVSAELAGATKFLASELRGQSSRVDDQTLCLKGLAGRIDHVAGLVLQVAEELNRVRSLVEEGDRG